MLVAATLHPLRVRLSENETIRLLPGQVVDLPDEQARKLLDKAPGKVRAVSPSLAAPRDPAPAPTGFCPRCGGGYWVRETREAAWTCGRCAPPARDPVADALFIPGGSEAPPTLPRPSTAPAGPTRCEPGPDRLVAWEGADGSIRQGEAVLLGMEGEGLDATLWVGVETPDGGFAWVRDDRLRPRTPATKVLP